MTIRASFRQSDIDRILKSAAKTGGVVQIDLREMIVTIFPPGSASAEFNNVQDGEEYWGRAPIKKRPGKPRLIREPVL